SLSSHTSIKSTAPDAFSTESAAGSTIVWEPSRAVAYVADANNRAVHAVDPSSKRVVTTMLDRQPEQLVSLDTKRVVVTLRDRNEIALLRFDADGAGKIVSKEKVKTEP